MIASTPSIMDDREEALEFKWVAATSLLIGWVVLFSNLAVGWGWIGECFVRQTALLNLYSSIYYAVLWCLEVGDQICWRARCLYYALLYSISWTSSLANIVRSSKDQRLLKASSDVLNRDVKSEGVDHLYFSQKFFDNWVPRRSD